MKPENDPLLAFTIRHFQEIARANRFAENAAIPHDTDRCLVCHPEKGDGDPFQIYVEVIAQAIPVRRPRLDEDLAAAIREDMQWSGQAPQVSLKDLQARTPSAMEAFRLWVRNALETGLELLSVHSPTSMAFSLDDAEEDFRRQAFVEKKIQDIMDAIMGEAGS
ncbi:hypothetical protein [Desulfosoma sp.]